MNIAEQVAKAEIIRAQIALLNESIALTKPLPTTEITLALFNEVLRLSRLIT